MQTKKRGRQTKPNSHHIHQSDENMRIEIKKSLIHSICFRFVVSWMKSVHIEGIWSVNTAIASPITLAILSCCCCFFFVCVCWPIQFQRTHISYPLDTFWLFHSFTRKLFNQTQWSLPCVVNMLSYSVMCCVVKWNQHHMSNHHLYEKKKIYEI